MPENIKASDELIDVGEKEGAEINLDEKGEAVKQEEVKEEIEVEQTTPAEDKTYENEKKSKTRRKKI